MMGTVILVIVSIIVAVFLFCVSPIFRGIVYFILGFIGLTLFFRFFVKKYDEYERGVIFRIGKFDRISGPGWSIVMPFFEKEFAKVDIRTNMMNLIVPSAFTQDDLKINLSGFIYYKIADPSKAVLKISNYITGLRSLVTSESRNVIGSMTMRELFANLDKLNGLLADRIRHSTWMWGIDVPMVQVEGVQPSEEIINAMKEKTIAKERLQAQRFRAEARKIAIEAIGEGAKKLDERAISYLYLKALEEIGKGKGTKLVFPMKFFDVVEDLGKEFAKNLKGSGIDITEAISAFKEKILSSPK